MSNKSTEPNNLNVALLAWCQDHSVDATKLSKDMDFTYFHAWRLLSGTSPVTAETLGRFALTYGAEAVAELLKIAGVEASVSMSTMPHPEGAQEVPELVIRGADRRSGQDRRSVTQPAQG